MIRSIVVALLALVVVPGHAQTWPTKQVRIVVAFAPGGSLDFVTRIVAERLSQDLGQSFVVENRAGANGNVAAEFVAKQAPDGYTILASADALTSSAHLYKLNFDPMKDLVPVVQFTRQPLVLAVHPSLEVRSVVELLAAAKKSPGMGYATSGAGSGQHMVGEWLARLGGVQLTHVPYKGGGQAITDLIGGQVKIGSLGSTPVMPHAKAGRLRIIAQSTATRSPSLPEVPTYTEAGLAIVLDQWLGFFVPAGTPPEVIARLNAATAKVLAAPEVRERIAAQGLEAIGGSQEAFAKLYVDDYDKYGRLVKELSIKID